MQITGKITNIVPDGSFNSAHGLVYKFKMSIDVDGTIQEGGINSKSQVYPMNVGDQILVESTTNQYGVNFKKVNPNFAGGSGQQQQQRPPQQQQQGGGQAPQSQEAPDWDKIARGKVTHGVVCGGIASGQLKCTSAEDVEMWSNLIMDAGE